MSFKEIHTIKNGHSRILKETNKLYRNTSSVKYKETGRDLVPQNRSRSHKIYLVEE